MPVTAKAQVKAPATAKAKPASKAKTAEPKVTKLPSQVVTGHPSASLSTHVTVPATPAISSARKASKKVGAKKASTKQAVGAKLYVWIPLEMTDKLVAAKFIGLGEDVFRIRKEDGSYRRSNGSASMIDPDKAQLVKLAGFASKLAQDKSASKSLLRACKETLRQVAKVNEQMDQQASK